MIKYPIGIQSFSDIRTGRYIYVDKTEYIYKLVNEGKYFFLSRPRRFGKSLLLNTIQCYFEGRKELFEGLSIYDLEHEWESRPVLFLSLSAYDNSDSNSLKDILDHYFKRWEDEYEIKNISPNFSIRFGEIIRCAYLKTGKKVAILIDEYDAPLVACMNDDEKYETIRSLLKSVYVNLKDQDDYIYFAMLSGVTRFSRMNIFSGLNNLNDISMLPKYDAICGITETELINNLEAGIEEYANTIGVSPEEMRRLLKSNYDGYHFTERMEDIYNPFSLFLALNNRQIRDYWYESGTPTFLIDILKNSDTPLSRQFDDEVTASAIMNLDAFRIYPTALLFQTGYLTIKGYNPVRKSYRLGVPNKEVENGLYTSLLSSRILRRQSDVELNMFHIRDAFETGNPQEGLERIKSLFAGIPANLTQNRPELYYENNLFLLFKLIGIDARAEWYTSDGRIDMLLVMPKHIYIMELKLDGSAEQALKQIESKDYTLQFTNSNKDIIAIGLNFSKSARNLDHWLIKTLP